MSNEDHNAEEESTATDDRRLEVNAKDKPPPAKSAKENEEYVEDEDGTHHLVVDAARKIPRKSVVTERPLPGHNALKEVVTLPQEDVDDLFENEAGPFHPELRVTCPDKGFGFRRSKHCKDCPWFGGVGERTIHGELDASKPENAKAKYSMVCLHPTVRNLHYLPEG